MAGHIWEFFGYKAIDASDTAADTVKSRTCPFIDKKCEKTFNDGVVSGVCSIKPMTSEPVICCPIRLYADGYKVLKDVSEKAFGPGHKLVPGKDAVAYSVESGMPCVAVFGQRWGGELGLPQKAGKGGYFVDWVLAKLDDCGELEEFVAVEVQTIDTTGTYRNGYESLIHDRSNTKTAAGLNWENVSKRILPQLVYKGQVLQRESLCKKGLFFICPSPVFESIMARLGGKEGLVKYALQPASITFLAYSYNIEEDLSDGNLAPLYQSTAHSTTVYKVQEAFNNVTLPDEDVYKSAILKALGKNV